MWLTSTWIWPFLSELGQGRRVLGKKGAAEIAAAQASSPDPWLALGCLHLQCQDHTKDMAG